MNIRWISPLNPELTEIGRYSRALMPYLEARFSLDMVSDSVEIHEEYDRGNHVLGMEPITIYNIGNSPMHCGILGHAMQVPGIVILHDLNLLELGLAYAREHHKFDPRRMVRDEYGIHAANDFEAMYGGSLYDWHGQSLEQYQEFVTAYPLFETFISNASGVVTHSEFALQKVKERFGGPAIKLELPYSVGDKIPPQQKSFPPLQMIFCGHAGPNRRLTQLLEGWAAVSDPRDFRLSLYGNIGNAEQLYSLATELGLRQLVDIHGFVEDDVLDKALADAHLAINLRYPTMGEASASQLRYWSSGLASLVSNIGWYGELPDDVAIKIDLSDEVPGITRALEGILSGKISVSRFAANGYRYLRESHSPNTYVDGLYEFVEKVAEDRFRTSLYNGKLLNTMASMCEDVHDSVLFEDTLSLISSMVGRR